MKNNRRMTLANNIIVEYTNERIIPTSRQAYGYPDDEYFFLKLFDMSRRSYERNPKSHNL